MRTKKFIFIILTSLALGSPHASAQEPAPPEPLDPSLKPNSAETISSVFKDMGVVQKRAMAKANRFLFSSYFSMDFSDGPYTRYAVHLNPGFAISDMFEIYANIAPLYIINSRSIVDRVANIVDSNGTTPNRITAAKPKYQLGVELLWAPLYGKDSVGVSRVLRSDTFFKLGVSQTTFDVSSGMFFKGGLGKTFFMGKNFGLRFCADYGYYEDIIDNRKAFQSAFFVEFGTVFYL